MTRPFHAQNAGDMAVIKHLLLRTLATDKVRVRRRPKSKDPSSAQAELLQRFPSEQASKERRLVMRKIPKP